MTDYNTISDTSIDSDSVLIQDIMFWLRDNPIAITEGSAGAPKIQTAAYDAASVDQNAIGAGAVHQSELDTSTGSVSTTTSIAGGATLTLPGGSYGFYPQLRISGGSGGPYIEAGITRSGGMNATSYTTVINLMCVNGCTGYAQQRYVNSSPPIDIGDGAVPFFFFGLVDANKNVVSAYAADVPPWLYNGPTPTTGKPVRMRDGRIKKMQARKVIDPQSRRVMLQQVEITNEIKNQDMNIIPHPFPAADLQAHSVVLFDPVSTAELLEFHEAGESIHDLILDDYLTFDNEPLARACPPGVMPVSFRWKLTGQR